MKRNKEKRNKDEKENGNKETEKRSMLWGKMKRLTELSRKSKGALCVCVRLCVCAWNSVQAGLGLCVGVCPPLCMLILSVCVSDVVGNEELHVVLLYVVCFVCEVFYKGR